jgi:hypothetical protein
LYQAGTKSFLAGLLLTSKNLSFIINNTFISERFGYTMESRQSRLHLESIMKMIYLAAARQCLNACRYAKDAAQRARLVFLAQLWIKHANAVSA